MTQITITFDPTDEKELADVAAFVNGVLGADAVAATAPAETKADEPDTSKADAEAEKKAIAAAKRKKAAADKKAKEGAEADDGPTREDVKAAIKDYAALEGRDAAIQILKDNGAASITELAEDKYADVIAACG